MATATTSIVFSNGTAAQFRAWAQWIHDQFTTTFGWVNTGDTGQIDLTTVSDPGATNTAMGYKIYRMDDALQATVPVYLKLEFGSGSNVDAPAVWVTLGTGSNGSGTLTGNNTTRTQFHSNGFDTVARNIYASGDDDRFVFAGTADSLSTATIGMIFGIERLKDENGANTNEGAVVFAIFNNSTAVFMQCLAPSGLQPPADSLYLCGQIQQLSTVTTNVLGADVYTQPITPNYFFPRNPIMNMVIYYNADITRETQFTLDMFGANHNFLAIGQPTTPGQRYNAADRINNTTVTRGAIRYE